jgi:hypothetical protein
VISWSSSIPSTAQTSTGPPLLFIRTKKLASNSYLHRTRRPPGGRGCRLCRGGILPAVVVGTVEKMLLIVSLLRNDSPLPPAERAETGVRGCPMNARSLACWVQFLAPSFSLGADATRVRSTAA